MEYNTIVVGSGMQLQRKKKIESEMDEEKDLYSSITTYCLVCREKTLTLSAKIIDSVCHRRLTGECSSCGCNKSTFVKIDDEQIEPHS